MANLMSWNGLSDGSIIQPGQKLLLQVTPPATITPTPGPPTAAPTLTRVPPSPTATLASTLADTPTPTSAPKVLGLSLPVARSAGIVLAVIVLLLVGFVLFRNR